MPGRPPGRTGGAVASTFTRTWAIARREPARSVGGDQARAVLPDDLLHPILQVKLLLLQLLLLDLLLHRQMTLRGELGEPALVVVVVLEERLVFLVIGGKLGLDLLGQGRH